MRVMPHWVGLVLILLVSACSAVWAGGLADEPESFFELKVRPVLAGTCLKCHGAVKASGGLRLDSREAMFRGGESGPAVLPGEPNKSLLIQAVEHADESLEMPPGKLLTKDVREDLAAWIAGGAKWPKFGTLDRTIEGRKHWAFEPINQVSPPDDPTGWATGPIDRFIGAGQRRHGLEPAPRPTR